MMILIRKILFLLLLILLQTTEGYALVLSKSTDLVTATVMTEYDNAVKGSMDILVKFEMKDGWHIYGDPAGEAAMPTTFNWNDSDIDLAAATVVKEFNFEGFRQFGYKDTAYYKFRLNKPVDIINLDITWLACNNLECAPERVSFNFGLPFAYESGEREASWNDEYKKALESFVEISRDNGKNANVWLIILMAFAGGIILNFMPCIFPILSIKAISLVQNVNKHRKARAESIFYFLGVMVSFLIIATILIVLRVQGESVGWGFQLQSPLFVIFMTITFFIIFLLFLDIISIKNPFTNTVGRISFAKQKLNAFVMGFFAVLIASPCTAPFMGVAIGYTLSQPLYMYYPVFIALGVGYALPFGMVGFFPRTLSKILPKPGKWMLILKRIFAIPVFITFLWLVWVLYAQLASRSIKDESVFWNTFDDELTGMLVDEGEPVFLDFTAKWCITCLANEKLVLETDEFREMVENKGIHTFKADWTLKDEAISRVLERYGRNSIPVYVFCENKKCEVLPQILTIDMLKKKIGV